jgi:hypothetical protein
MYVRMGALSKIALKVNWSAAKELGHGCLKHKSRVIDKGLAIVLRRPDGPKQTASYHVIASV